MTYVGNALNQANAKDVKTIASDKVLPISPSPYSGIPRKEAGRIIKATQKTHHATIKRTTIRRKIKINKIACIISFIFFTLNLP